MVDARHCALDVSQKYGPDPDTILSKVRDFYNSQTDVAELPYDGSREVCESIAQRGGINALVTHRERSSTIAMLTRFRMLELFTTAFVISSTAHRWNKMKRWRSVTEI
jgi:phosphoglycolate phosphatase-like HAD superfamily hydrolase